ncbi:transposable element Tcb2 transposase [Trichonephila clavipes]|nr:transposable element Tcb2 transposase [Trichonephila clavipes]
MSTMSQRSHLTDSEAWRVVGRIWNRFLETGSAGRRPEQGRRRATTPNEDLYLVLTARRHRNMNAGFARLLAPRFQLRISETGYMVHIFIWRDRGSRNNPAFVHESVRFGGGGVVVYGGISIDGRTDLYIIQDGLMTAHRYRDEVLRPQ